MENQLALNQEPSVGMMLQAVIDQGITDDKIKVLEAMVGLKERCDDKAAEKEFTRAFVAMQNEIPQVVANKIIAGKDGSIRSKYADYQKIMEEIDPIRRKHGFAITFNTSRQDGRVIVYCTLMHEGGHSKTNEYAVRIGQGPPASSDAQADGSAITYARRGALCNALNIAIDTDTDARAEGGRIDPADAQSIQERVKALGFSEEKFLKWAGSESYDEIREDKLDMILEYLCKREAQKAEK